MFIVSVEISFFSCGKGNFVQFLLNGGHKNVKSALLVHFSLAHHAANVLF